MASIDVTVLNNTVYFIEVSGRIDSSNASELGEALTELVSETSPKLLIGLAGVEYMSSAGLRELVAAFKQAHNNSGDVRLCSPSERVSEVLSLSGLDSIFQIYDSVEDAIADYAV